MTQTDLTEGQLLQGSWYALEQAGRLLRSAVDVFGAGDFGTAAGLAALGREELGRSRILRAIAKRARDEGPQRPAKVKQECQDHAAKQRAASGTVSLVGAHGTTLGSLIRTSITEPIHSAEWEKAQRELADVIDRKHKRQPDDRHELRMRAFYVDVDPGGHWRRPAQISREVAYATVNEFSNDYAQERDRLRDDAIESDFPEMEAARRGMEPGFKLPEPQWPQ